MSIKACVRNEFHIGILSNIELLHALTTACKEHTLV